MKLIMLAVAFATVLSAGVARGESPASQPADLESMTRQQLIELVAELRGSCRQSQAQFDTLVKRLDALSVQLTTSAAERTRLSQELARLRMQLADRAGGDAEAERLRKQLAEALARAATMQERLGQAATRAEKCELRNAICEQRVAEVSAQRDLLLEQVKTLREQATRLAANQPAASQPEPRTPQVIHARIAEVRGRLVTLNVGHANGVAAGMVFTVSRGTTHLARLEIREVGRSVSMGMLIDVYKPVEVGDAAAIVFERK